MFLFKVDKNGLPSVVPECLLPDHLVFVLCEHVLIPIRSARCQEAPRSWCSDVGLMVCLLCFQVITQLTGESFDLGPDISVLGSDPSPVSPPPITHILNHLGCL